MGKKSSSKSDLENSGHLSGSEIRRIRSSARSSYQDVDQLDRKEMHKMRLAHKRGDLDGDGKLDSKEMQYIADFSDVGASTSFEMVQLDEYEAAQTANTIQSDSDHASDDEDLLLPHHKHINKQNVINKLIRYRLHRRNYASLLMFVLFMASFFTMLISQRRQEDVTALSRTLRVEISKLTKSTKEMKDTEAFWKWLDGTLLPGVFARPWESEVKYGGNYSHKMRGYQLDDYNNLVAGIWVHATRRQERQCGAKNLYNPAPGNQPCFHLAQVWDNSDKKSLRDRDFATTSHQIFFPSTFTLNELLQVSKRHKELGTVGAGTDGILIEFMAYNPTTETIASIEFQLAADITGHWKAYLYVNAIPRVIYPTHSAVQFWFQICIEGVFVIMWSLLAISFIRGMLRSWHWTLPSFCQSFVGTSGFFTPAFLAAPEYEHSPGDWRVFYLTALIMHCLIVADGVVWMLLNYQSHQLNQLAELHHDSLTTVLEDKLQAGNISPPDFAERYSEAFQTIQTATNGVAWMFHNYFVLCGCTAVAMTLRLFEYLHFQKKLSVITETFMGSMGELLHLFFVLSLTVCGFGFAMHLILGGQILAFSSFGRSVFNVWQMIFNTWKVKPNQLKYDVRVIAEGLIMSFRLFVILLLLKMLFAMIFEGYKTVAAKKSKKGQSVLKDVVEIMWHVWNYLSSYTGAAYVNPIRIEVALRDDKLKNIQSLNSVAMIHQLRAVFPKAKYGMAHAEWIINKYGTSKPVEGTDYASLAIPPTEELKQMIRDTFNEFDTDKSHMISQGELRRALERMGVTDISRKQMKQMLTKLGVDPHNRNAELGIDQFCALLTGYNLNGDRFWDDEHERIEQFHTKKKEKVGENDKKAGSKKQEPKTAVSSPQGGTYGSLHNKTVETPLLSSPTPKKASSKSPTTTSRLAGVNPFSKGASPQFDIEEGDPFLKDHI